MTNNYGLEISQENKSVDSPVPTDKVFSTQFSTLPIYKIFTLNYSVAGFGFDTKYIRHELPFVPFALMYYNIPSVPNRWQIYPLALQTLTNGSDDIQPVVLRIDKENMTVELSNNSPSTRTIILKIIVFAFPIALSL